MPTQTIGLRPRRLPLRSLIDAFVSDLREFSMSAILWSTSWTPVNSRRTSAAFLVSP